MRSCTGLLGKLKPHVSTADDFHVWSFCCRIHLIFSIVLSVLVWQRVFPEPWCSTDSWEYVSLKNLAWYAIVLFFLYVVQEESSSVWAVLAPPPDTRALSQKWPQAHIPLHQPQVHPTQPQITNTHTFSYLSWILQKLPVKMQMFTA